MHRAWKQGNDGRNSDAAMTVYTGARRHLQSLLWDSSLPICMNENLTAHECVDEYLE